MGRVCLSVYRRPLSKAFRLFAHPVPLRGLRVKFIYEGYRVKVKVTEPQKGENYSNNVNFNRLNSVSINAVAMPPKILPYRRTLFDYVRVSIGLMVGLGLGLGLVVRLVVVAGLVVGLVAGLDFRGHSICLP